VEINNLTTGDTGEAHGENLSACRIAEWREG
jgi:hypothetical protein